MVGEVDDDLRHPRRPQVGDPAGEVEIERPADNGQVAERLEGGGIHEVEDGSGRKVHRVVRARGRALQDRRHRKRPGGSCGQAEGEGQAPCPPGEGGHLGRRGRDGRCQLAQGGAQGEHGRRALDLVGRGGWTREGQRSQHFDGELPADGLPAGGQDRHARGGSGQGTDQVGHRPEVVFGAIRDDDAVGMAPGPVEHGGGVDACGDIGPRAVVVQQPRELDGEPGLADARWAEHDQAAGGGDRGRRPPQLFVPAHELAARGGERRQGLRRRHGEAQPGDVVGQGGGLEVAQLWPGLDAEGLDQRAPGVLVGGEGVGRATGEVPGPEELPPAMLAEGLALDRVPRRGFRTAGLPCEEQELHPQLDGVPVDRLEVVAGGRGDDLPLARERCAPPQGEGGVDQGQARRRVVRLTGVGLVQEIGRQGCVQLTGTGRQRVPVR